MVFQIQIVYSIPIMIQNTKVRLLNNNKVWYRMVKVTVNAVYTDVNITLLVTCWKSARKLLRYHGRLQPGERGQLPSWKFGKLILS